MNDLAIQILSRLGIASGFLAASGIVAVALLTGFRCRSPFVHRATWCLVLAQGVLVFQMPISVPWHNESVREHAADNVVTFYSAHLAETMPASPVDLSASADSIQDWNWAAILLVAWTFGILFILGRWAIGYVQLIRNVASEECDLKEWSREWTEVAKDRSITTPPPLHISRTIGPLLCLWPTGYRIVVPYELWRNLTSQQRQDILRHELAHFERHDIFKTLIANLLALIHWFNPIAWFAVRRFEDSIEWTCDDLAQASTQDHATNFARALLAIGEHDHQRTAWTSAIFGGGLSGRIRRMLSSEKSPDSRPKTCLAIGVLVGLLLLHVVRIDLVAQEPDNSGEKEKQRVPKNNVSQKFFVVPVKTEFQKFLLGGKDFVAYANIDGPSFIDTNTGMIDPDRFDFKALQKSLRSVREKCGRGRLKVMIEYGYLGQRPDEARGLEAFIKSALGRQVKDAGFEKVKFIGTWYNDDDYRWKGLPKVGEAHGDEKRLGNDEVLVFAVQTPLGRFLSGGVDYYIDIPGPFPLDARHIFSDADKTIVRKAIKANGIPDNASIKVHVIIPKSDDCAIVPGMTQGPDMTQGPGMTHPSGMMQPPYMPQAKKGSYFHRDAVDFLKSLGFDQVIIVVDVGPGSHVISVYK